MSFPPGTEMFQFPGFASCTYEFSTGYPSRGGFPHSDIRGSTIARISPRLIAACHVLHRLLAPRHPPDALLSLDTPSTTDTTDQPEHRRPHAGPNRAQRRTTIQANPSRPHRRSISIPPAMRQAGTHLLSLLTNHSRLHLSKSMPASGAPQGPHANRRSWKRPPKDTAGSAVRRPGSHGARRHACLRRIGASLAQQGMRQWRRPDSNRRPPACKAGALPTELRPQNSRHHRRHPPRGDGSRRSAARPARWAGTPRSPPGDCLRAPQRAKAMGQGGLEPPTPRLSSVCSDQLSYWPPAPARHRRHAGSNTRPAGFGGRMRGRRPDPLARTRRHRRQSTQDNRREI